MIFKQPNGLYGRWSYNSDDFADIGITKEQYCVGRIQQSVIASIDEMKRVESYERGIQEAEEYIEELESQLMDNADQYDEEDLNDMKEEIKERKANLYNVKLEAEKEPSELHHIQKEYYGELYKLIDNLCVSFDMEKYENRECEYKEYLISKNPEHMREMAVYLKNINEKYESFKNGK